MFNACPNFLDWGHCVKETIDGGFIIASESYSDNWECNFWLIKTDDMCETLGLKQNFFDLI